MGRSRPSFSSQLLVPVFFYAAKRMDDISLLAEKKNNNNGKTGRSEVLKSKKIERKFL
jgi:hypothetical protein